MAQALDEAPRPAVAAGGLSTEEQIQRAIMTCCKWESGTEIVSSKMREWCWPQFRNRALAKFSEKVLTAMDELAKMGLLKTTNDEKHGKGHLVRQFKKTSWVDGEANAEAAALCRKLAIGRDVFE